MNYTLLRTLPNKRSLSQAKLHNLEPISKFYSKLLWYQCPIRQGHSPLLREFGIRKALKKLVIPLIICTFIGENQQVTNKDKAMITKDKVTEIFCIIDEFNRNLNSELENNLFLPTNSGKGKRYRNRKGRLSESEIMTILVCYHFGTYRNFKEYYLNCIRG